MATDDDTSGDTTGEGPLDTSAGSSGASSITSDGSSGGSSASTGLAATPECLEYCDEFIPNCNEVADVEPYDDVADCHATCSGFAHDGVVGGFQGDTVQCRLAHLTFDPDPPPGYYELHCLHAQENPVSECV